MFFSIENGDIPASHVSLPEGRPWKVNILNPKSWRFGENMKFLFQLGVFFGCCSKRNFLVGTDTNIPHKNGKKTGKGKIIDSNIPWRYSLVRIFATSICWSFFYFKTTSKNLIYKVSGQLEIPQGQLEIPQLMG